MSLLRWVNAVVAGIIHYPGEYCFIEIAIAIGIEIVFASSVPDHGVFFVPVRVERGYPGTACRAPTGWMGAGGTPGTPLPRTHPSNRQNSLT